MPRATTSSRVRGIPGAVSEGRGGGACRCAYIIDGSPSPSNGGRPVSASASTQVSAYTSTRWSLWRDTNRSGAM